MQFVSVYNFLDVLVVFLLGFFCLFLLRLRNGNRLSHRLLAAFLGSLALSYMDGVFLSFGFRFHYSFPYMVYITMSFDYLVGPLLYLYVLSRTRTDFRLGWRHAVHGVVFLLHFLFIFFRYHVKSLEEKRSILSSHQVISYQEIYNLVVLSYVHYFFYMVLVIVTLVRYQRNIKQILSDIHRANLRWLLVICSGLLLGGLLRLTNNLLWLEVPESNILRVVDFKLFAISAVFIFACTVVYKSLQQPEVLRLLNMLPEPSPIPLRFDGGGTSSTTMTPASVPEIKPVAQGARRLAPERRAELKQMLLEYMKAEQPFLNPDLTLYDLAGELGISAHHLSEVINNECGSNFYDFINGYRLHMCMERLRDSRNQKYISQIMYECGFNSKSVFNTLFKRATRMTPSQFRKDNSPARA